MPLSPETRLGPYEIISAIGAGGMGEVYKARDTRLGREVALKVLPANAGLTAARKQRFLQEAQAASALNHPNIVIIHDVGSEGGVDFLAMEYVRGKTLDQLIGRKGLPLDQTLRYSVAICKGLAAAHAAGIVHRDVKPNNVMVSENGQVKLLDFGLAKLTEPVSPGEDAGTLTMGDTTEPGTILGTVSYMSPEQAEGKPVDARSDIFSFGAVLYEMVTGARAFRGDSKLSTLSAILRDEPRPVSQIVQGIPPDLEKIITRCLRKDRARRFQHADDIQVALEELQSDSVPHTARRVNWTIMAAAVLFCAGAAALWLRMGSSNRAPRSALVQLTKDGGYTGYPTLSPDAKLTAYLSDRARPGNLDLRVQQTGSSAAVQLTRDYIFHDPPIDVRPPAFSPDGTRILFGAGHEAQGIYEVSALGGDPRLVVSGGHAPQYSSDGKWISYGQVQKFIAFLIPASGGEPRQIHPEFFEVDPPVWSPDGRLLFRGQRDIADRAQCFWVSSIDGPALPTGLCTEMPAFGLTNITRVSAWTQQDELVFSAVRGDSTNLWRARLSRNSFKLEGAPEQITFGTGVEHWPSISGRHMAFSSASTLVDLAGLPLDANRAAPHGPLEMLTHDTANDFSPSISRDGSQIVYASDLRGNSDIFLKDMRSGKTRVLAGTPEEERRPFISPDGAEVVYSMDRAGKTGLYLIPISGGGPRMICANCGIPRGWSADRSTLMLWNYTKKGTVSMLEVRTGNTIEVLRDAELGITHPELSPDDRWIAFFVFKDADTFQVFVAPWRRDEAIRRSAWIPITSGKSRNVAPAWSPDGNLLYFVEVGTVERLFAQRLDPETRQPVGAPINVPLDLGPRQFLRNWKESVVQVARDRVIFSTEQDTSNIWVTDLPEGR